MKKSMTTGLFVIIVSLVGLIILSGCRSEQVQEQASRLTSLEGEAFEIDLPREAVEVLIERLENGDATLEQAVLENLSFVVGESEYEELYGEESLRFESGWGLTLLANEAYAYADEETRGEIERLLNILAPAQENLDLFAAQDESQSQIERTKVSRQISAPQSQSVICATIWTDGFPRTFEDPPICVLYRSFSAGGHEYRVYFPEEKRDDAEFMRYVDTAVVGLKESQRRLSEYSEVPDINLVFTLLPSPSGGSVWAAATIPGVGREVLDEVACPITVFPSSIEEDLERLKFNIAHEMFHCISMNRKGYTGYRSAAWYQEGLAEYFANLVYPRMNFEHERTPYFDQDSVDNSLFEMSYENVVFFQYLANRFDPDYLLRLHDAMPEWDPVPAQAAALSGFDDMQTIFFDFAKAYGSHSIVDTGGGNLPIVVLVPPEDVYEIGEGREVGFSSTAFTLRRIGLLFDSGVEYEISKDTGGDEGKNAWRERNSSMFSEIPDEFSISCDERPAQLVMLTTAPSGASDSSETELELGFEAGEETHMDCCLIGTWEQSSGEIRSNIGTILAGSGMSLSDVSGRFVLTITNSKTMTFFPEGYTVTVVDPDGKEVTGSVVGSNTSTFTLPEEGRIAPSDDDPHFVLTLSVSGESVSFPLDSSSLGGGPFSGGASFGYTCDERTFTAFTEGAAPFSTTSFTRISPVPVTPPPPEDFPEASGAGPGAIPDIGAATACLLITATGFSTGEGEVSWRITNGMDEAVEMAALSLSWPASNGALEEIQANGESLWLGTQSVGPARIEGPWLSTLSLAPGADTVLDLRFTSGPISSSPYILVLDFTNGCIFSDVQ